MSGNIDDNFERVCNPGEEKRASKRRTRSGIKAIITVSDLQCVVNAAKKWQDKLVEDGVDASKLLHHIANAEKVLVKYRNRNKLAFDRRQQRREEEAKENEVPPTLPNQEPSKELGRGAWDILSALGLGGKRTEANGKEEARPTRW